MDHLAGLPNDTLSLVCLYLHPSDIGRLYETNDRIMMRRLISPGVCPQLRFTSFYTPHCARFINDHTSLWSFSTLNPSEKPDSIFEYSHRPHVTQTIDLHPRLLLSLKPSLVHLEISAILLNDPYLRPVSETFASMFPVLKTLIFRDSESVTASAQSPMDQLLRALPPHLEKLVIQAAFVTPRMDQLPPTLTELHICEPVTLYTLTVYPPKWPTLELMKRLNAQTPNLTSLTALICEAMLRVQRPFVPVPTDQFEVETDLLLLPHLRTLNLLGNRPVEEELTLIIKSVPHVQSFGLKASQIAYGREEDVAKKEADEMRAAAHAPAPIAPAVDFFGFNILAPAAGPTGVPSGSIACVFPSNLTQLSVSSMELSVAFFRSLPASLLSLTISNCSIPWCLRFGELWEPLTTPPFVAPSLFSFGSTKVLTDEDATPEDWKKPAWTSLLPRNLARLVVFDASNALPLHVNYLPASICELVYRNASIKPSLNTPKHADHKSLIRWPSGLTSLTLHKQVSKADSLVLPPTLTFMECTLTDGWNQDDAKELLDHLPNCIVKPHNSIMWITDSSHTTILPPSSAGMTESGRAERGENDSLFSAALTAQRQLAILPPRIYAEWHFGTPENSVIPAQTRESASIGPTFAPKGTLPLTLSPAIRTAVFPLNWMPLPPYGHIHISIEAGISMLSAHSKLEEIRFEQRAASRLTAQFSFSKLLQFPNLTSVTMRQVQAVYIPFLDLPRTLTCLSLGVDPIYVSSKAQFQIHRANEEGPARRLFASPTPTSAYEVADLPRGLVRLEIPSCPIPPSGNGDWPRGITSLHFCSDCWEDRQVLTLPDRFNQAVAITINGSVLSYGNQRPFNAAELYKPSNESAMKVDKHEEKTSPSCDPSSSSEDKEPRIEVVKSLDVIHSKTLADILAAPFVKRGILVRSFALPSPLVVASPSLHTFSFLYEEEFEVIHHRQTIDGSDPAPGSIQRRGDARKYHTDQSSFECSDTVLVSQLASYRSLTSFTCASDLTWDHVASLPETLRTLSICLSASHDIVVDPFIRLPRMLETLQLDCGSKIVLTEFGLPQLPPNLTTLECNLLTFNPSLIPEWPLQITSVLFDAQGIWTDLDLYALVNHMGKGLKKFSVSHCLLTGALLPLDAPPYLDILRMVNLTKERLEEAAGAEPDDGKLFVSWYQLATPLTLCALDLAPESAKNDLSRLRSSSLPMTTPPASIICLDLHMVLYSLMDGLLPFTMPPMLTTLNVRTKSALTCQEAAALPRTIIRLKQQICSSDIWMHPSCWSQLPRGLETLWIDIVAQHPRETTRPEIVKPYSYTIIELPLMKYPLQDPPAYPSYLERMPGLPTDKLGLLYLRPYYLGSGCFEDFGTLLSEIHCADIDEPVFPATRSPGLKVFAQVPGMLSTLYFSLRDNNTSKSTAATIFTNSSRSMTVRDTTTPQKRAQQFEREVPDLGYQATA